MGLGLFQLLDDVALSRADKGSGLHQPQDHVHVAERPLRRAQHVAPQLVLRPVDARRIQEDDLAFFAGIHGLNAVSCGLGLS